MIHNHAPVRNLGLIIIKFVGPSKGGNRKTSIILSHAEDKTVPVFTHLQEGLWFQLHPSVLYYLDSQSTCRKICSKNQRSL